MGNCYSEGVWQFQVIKGKISSKGFNREENRVISVTHHFAVLSQEKTYVIGDSAFEKQRTLPTIWPSYWDLGTKARSSLKERLVQSFWLEKGKGIHSCIGRVKNPWWGFTCTCRGIGKLSLSGRNSLTIVKSQADSGISAISVNPLGSQRSCAP